MGVLVEVKHCELLSCVSPVVRWTERNIVNQKLNKALQQMERKGK